MPSTTSEKNIERLEEIFTTHGLPLSVTSDNRPQFRSDVFERYFEGCGVEHRKTTPLCIPAKSHALGVRLTPAG